MTECTSTVGVDHNLRNLTVGNESQIHYYDLPRAVKIARTTMRIVASFKRDDVRIRTDISSKYGRRRTARTGHILHNVTKTIVERAVHRRLSNEQSTVEKQSFWKISVGFAVSTVRVTVGVEDIVVG